MNAPSILDRDTGTESKGERLIARAQDCSRRLREAVERDVVDSRRALRIANMIDEALHAPLEQPVLKGRNPELSSVAYILREYGEAIDFICRQEGAPDYFTTPRVSVGV